MTAVWQSAAYTLLRLVQTGDRAISSTEPGGPVVDSLLDFQNLADTSPRGQGAS